MSGRTIDMVESSTYGFSYDKHPSNAWVYPDGKILPTSFTRHNRVALSIITKSGWEEEFNKANANKNYDAREFLIIVKDFISINSGRFNFCGSATTKQKKALGVDPAQAKFKMDCFFSD
jgi:hypothetical protein